MIQTQNEDFSLRLSHIFVEWNAYAADWAHQYKRSSAIGGLLARYYHWLLATTALVHRSREPTEKESIGNGKPDGTMGKRAAYHAYVVSIQKRLCELRRLATFGCYFTWSRSTKRLAREERGTSGRRTTYYSVTSSRTMSGEIRGVLGRL